MRSRCRWIDCDYVIRGAAEAKGEVITIGADVNEMNALLRYGLAEYPWREKNAGNKVKTSPILKLAAGGYTLNVFPAAAGSTFSMTFRVPLVAQRVGCRSAAACRQLGLNRTSVWSAPDLTRLTLTATLAVRSPPKRWSDIMSFPESLGATMRRREFISLIASATAWPLAACAQHASAR
jgi:hypothetical protein